ncbi:complement factor B-like [Hypomesus transpacificus]|uniref:complement factor B-like n=1 Tax=Hypomesus transpacificus TaxID=137520 RepID=UPI001F073488|nr:complement factor B-like [Hypomesus transpacificus]
MGCRLHFSWFAMLVFSPFHMGVSIQCSLEKMDILGGHYTLTKGQDKGSTLIYHCPENHYAYPDTARLCQASGRWIPARSRPPKCKVIECPQPKLENGVFTPSQNTYLWNNMITSECYSGYTLRGSSRRVCQSSGKWSGSTPVCVSSSEDYCPNPGIPAGATRSGISFGVDDKVTYSCDARLYMIGSNERTCLENHQWSGAEPKCYFPHTYDTPLEIAKAFGSSISETLNELDDGSKVGKKISLDEQGLLNIFIAMDVSLSIDKKDFLNAKEAVKLLIKKIASFEVTPKYHIVFFASEVMKVVDIAESDGTTIDVLRKLDQFDGLIESFGTDLSLAFKAIGEQINIFEVQAIKKNDKKSFEDQKHVIIMFTDGQYNMGGDPKPQVDIIKEKVYMGNQKARDSHLDIYIFGVGDIIFPHNIKDLVTVKPNEQHYFKVQGGLTGLNETFDKIIDSDKLLHLCGVYNRTNDKTTYPWAVNIHVTRPDKTQNCLGSLVAGKFVLTAAHCFQFDDQPDDIKVDIGTKKGLKVEKFTFHEKYNISAKVPKIKEFYDYDMALIELKKEVRYSAEVRSICVPCTKETNRALGKQLHLTCKDQEQLLFSKNFEEVHFLSFDENKFAEKTAYALLHDLRDNCIKPATKAKDVNTDDPKDVVTDSFLCTGGSTGRQEHIACKGDSGGAVFKEYEFRVIQVALVSWGNKDLCYGQRDKMQKARGDSRDFHINLFRMIPFLKTHLGSELTFLEE